MFAWDLSKPHSLKITAVGVHSCLASKDFYIWKTYFRHAGWAALSGGTQLSREHSRLPRPQGRGSRMTTVLSFPSQRLPSLPFHRTPGQLHSSLVPQLLHSPLSPAGEGGHHSTHTTLLQVQETKLLMWIKLQSKTGSWVCLLWTIEYFKTRRFYIEIWLSGLSQKIGIFSNPGLTCLQEHNILEQSWTVAREEASAPRFTIDSAQPTELR